MQNFRHEFTAQSLYWSLHNILLSDNHDAFKLALSFCNDIDTLSIKRNAEARGNTKIMQCLGMQSQPLLPIPILQKIPKSEEFPYVNVMEKLKTMMMNKCKTNLNDKTSNNFHIGYKELLRSVHAKESVNYSESLCYVQV